MASGQSVDRGPVSTPSSRSVTHIRAGRGLWPPVALNEVWAYRDVGLLLALRDVKLRYKQTFFGVTWALIQPLVALAVFVLLLGNLLDPRDDGIPYVAFVLVGLAVWFPLASAVNSAADSLVQDPEILTKVWFPRVLAPLAAVMAATVDLVISVTIAVVVAVIAGIDLAPQLLLLPVGMLAIPLVAFGFGLWLAALNVLYRDVRYALPFALQVLFFASPIVYSSSEVSGDWSALYDLNPVVGATDLLRWIVLDAAAPGAEALLSAAMTLLLILSGSLFFRRTERQFADRV